MISLKKLPETPGVYLFKNAKNEILYIGKAANLKRRVSSYFQKTHDARITQLVAKISGINFQKTDSVLEALILESQLIKKHEPPYNMKGKDDKSFLYVEFTKEKFPRLLLVRGKNITSPSSNQKTKNYKLKPSIYGPFISGSNLREALRILRKIFPWNLHPDEKIGKMTRPCFDFEIGLCPGACVGKINRRDYLKTVRQLRLFFENKKQKIVKESEKEMKIVSKSLDFERALKIRKQIFALKHIQDSTLVNASNVQNSIRQLADKIKKFNKKITFYF